jgi:lantibiotic modifying enzyme
VLYRPEAFEQLTDAPWDEARVRAAIRAIVEDADEHVRGPKLLWPVDDWDGWHGTSPMKNLYVGTAGVVWALDELRRRGLAETKVDLGDIAARTLELFRARPDFMKGMKLPSTPEAALLTGESGILLSLWRVVPSAETADDLHARVRANVDNEADELMWGSPGTMVAAHQMYEWTGEERWREAWNDSADALLARRGTNGLWTQRLYGRETVGLGAPHGLVGNVLALRPLLDDARRTALDRDTNEVLARTAVREDGIANWPYSDRPALPSHDGQIRVQWCAGGPGIVISAAEYLDEELLLAGAELPWCTGPPNLEKGAGICHGTAGNGYAFLKTFARTGDERWLDRARRFAMHALEQVDRLKASRGRGRYSLWTGDVGTALYAADCLEGRSAYPVLG